MSTLGQALADAARRQAAIVAETVGDTSVLDRVLATQSQIFGVPMTVDGPAQHTPAAAPSHAAGAPPVAPQAAPTATRATATRATTACSPTACSPTSGSRAAVRRPFRGR